MNGNLFPKVAGIWTTSAIGLNRAASLTVLGRIHKRNARAVSPCDLDHHRHVDGPEHNSSLALWNKTGSSTSWQKRWPSLLQANKLVNC